MKNKKDIFFIIVYTIITGAFLFMFIWQAVNHYIVIPQMILLICCIVTLLCDIFSIKNCITNKKTKNKDTK